MKKKLLIYAHYFYPDVASTGQILTELTEGMRDTFDITVICVVPSYSGTVEEKYKTKRMYIEEIKIKTLNFFLICTLDNVVDNRITQIQECVIK